MELTTKRESIYHGMGQKPEKRYFVYLRGERIGNGGTKEEALRDAEQTLADAYTYLTWSSVAKVAIDGTIIVFRQLSDTSAMYEFCRGEDGVGRSSCTGKMSNGLEQFRTLGEYAYYVLTQYNQSHCNHETVGTVDNAQEYECLDCGAKVERII